VISFQKRFLFVHIHKTAGNSIQSVLRHHSEDEIVSARAHQDGIERFGIRNRKYNIKKHSTLAEYFRALGEEQFRGLYKFTCVRNPWDRLISFYFTPSQGVAKWDRHEFKKLVLKVSSVADYLRLGSEADPFANVQQIIRFENLADDFRAVCADLNIPAATLPEYNRSVREHYSQYYDDELRQLVRKRFAADIDRFAYTFNSKRDPL
jgi:sulfotransferase famil protein